MSRVSCDSACDSFVSARHQLPAYQVDLVAPTAAKPNCQQAFQHDTFWKWCNRKRYTYDYTARLKNICAAVKDTKQLSACIKGHIRKCVQVEKEGRIIEKMGVQVACLEDIL